MSLQPDSKNTMTRRRLYRNFWIKLKRQGKKGKSFPFLKGKTRRIWLKEQGRNWLKFSAGLNYSQIRFSIT